MDCCNSALQTATERSKPAPHPHGHEEQIKYVKYNSLSFLESYNYLNQNKTVDEAGYNLPEN